MNRRDFFVGGTGLAAFAQAIVAGYDAVTDGEVIASQTFENVAVGILVRANNVTIKRCTFRRLVSDGRNGTAVIVQSGIVGTRILECEVDGRDSLSDCAGIVLQSGCRGVVVGDCYIHHMQRIGLSMGAITYAEFPSPLPDQSEHYITRNVIEYCGTIGVTGDEGAGILIFGQSNRHTVRENRVRRNRGHGIALSGSMRGDGTRGTPKLDESPTWNVIDDNIVEYNGDDGIRNSGANYTWIRHNFCYANGGVPITVVPVGGTSDSRGVLKIENREIL